jgi:hypothetical protein
MARAVPPSRSSTVPLVREMRGRSWPGPDTRPIRGGEFVKIADLRSLGFGERFVQLAIDGFPSAGSYMDAKASIGL